MPNQEEVERSVEAGERRREARHNQPAAVKVRMQRPGNDVEFQAVLVNNSRGGLAIRHWRKDLTLSSHVLATLPGGEEFTARVKWNWINGPLVISGLERVPSGEFVTSDSRNRLDAVRTFARVTSRGWAVGAVAGLLIVLGWYLKTRIL